MAGRQLRQVYRIKWKCQAVRLVLEKMRRHRQILTIHRLVTLALKTAERRGPAGALNHRDIDRYAAATMFALPRFKYPEVVARKRERGNRGIVMKSNETGVLALAHGAVMTWAGSVVVTAGPVGVRAAEIARWS